MVTRLGCSEDDLVTSFFFYEIPVNSCFSPKNLFEHRGEIEKKKKNLGDLNIIEVDIADDLFRVLEKKEKIYGPKEKKDLILLVDLPSYFYTDKPILTAFSKAVKGLNLVPGKFGLYGRKKTSTKSRSN